MARYLDDGVDLEDLMVQVNLLTYSHFTGFSLLALIDACNVLDDYYKTRGGYKTMFYVCDGEKMFRDLSLSVYNRLVDMKGEL